jgi:hypothetical protein
MIVFEVQKNVGGQWRSYALFDEKTLAVDAAKDLMQQRVAPAAARVVQDSGDGSPPRTIFRQSSVDDHNLLAHRQRLDLERNVLEQRAQRKQARAAARATAAAARANVSRRKRWILFVLRVVLVLAACIGVVGFVHFRLAG